MRVDMGRYGEIWEDDAGAMFETRQQLRDADRPPQTELDRAGLFQAVRL